MGRLRAPRSEPRRPSSRRQHRGRCRCHHIADVPRDVGRGPAPVRRHRRLSVGVRSPRGPAAQMFATYDGDIHEVAPGHLRFESRMKPATRRRVRTTCYCAARCKAWPMRSGWAREGHVPAALGQRHLRHPPVASAQSARPSAQRVQLGIRGALGRRRAAARAPRAATTATSSCNARSRAHAHGERAPAPGGAAPPGAEDGSRRPAGRWHRARLQQPAVGDPQLHRARCSETTRRGRLGRDIARSARPASAPPSSRVSCSRSAGSRCCEAQVVDLNEIVASMQQMLRRVIGEDIELDALASCRPRQGAAPIAGSIEQVIMNLVVNARDAMPRRRQAHHRDRQRRSRRGRTHATHARRACRART